jgi:ABC-type transport system substrate-binding protein
MSGMSHEEETMTRKDTGTYRILKFGLAGVVAFGVTAASAETPKRGGVLTYMIPADAGPSHDGHRETTYAVVHATAPFYSVLIRVNPSDPASTTDFRCDLCTEMPKPTDNGLTYTFKIRKGVKFHDGSPLTAQDVAASWNKIVQPPKGVARACRQLIQISTQTSRTPARNVLASLSKRVAMPR